MDFGIRGRVAVVTGGDSGMGLKTAELLLREGVRVVLSDQETGKVGRPAAHGPMNGRGKC